MINTRLKINSLFLITLLLCISFSFSKLKKAHLKRVNNTITIPKSNDEQIYYYIANTTEKCSISNCNGECTSSHVCKCEEGYANIKSNSKIYCSYKQKSQLAAFLFELFLPFGVGHLYVGRYLFGITKMIIVTSPLTICLFTFLGILVSDKFLNGGNSSLVCIGVVFLFSIVGLVWWVADLVLFGTNNYSDGNNVPLNPW